MDDTKSNSGSAYERSDEEVSWDAEFANMGERKGRGKEPKSVRDLAVYGMWKDRDDIGTGREYVSRIREYSDEPWAMSCGAWAPSD